MGDLSAGGHAVLPTVYGLKELARIAQGLLIFESVEVCLDVFKLYASSSWLARETYAH